MTRLRHWLSRKLACPCGVCRPVREHGWVREELENGAATFQTGGVVSGPQRVMVGEGTCFLPLSVSITTDKSPDEVAQAVVEKLRRIDHRRGI